MVTPPTTKQERWDRLLFVCLGNICRSPAAEAIFSTMAEKAGLKLDIESAGTSAYHCGEPPDRRMRQALAKRGYETRSTAQAIAEHHIESFDLILAMDEQNFMNLRRFFSHKPELLSKIVRICDFGSERFAHHHEVPDPYYGGQDGFELVIDLLEDACAEILRRLLEQDPA